MIDHCELTAAVATARSASRRRFSLTVALSAVLSAFAYGSPTNLIAQSPQMDVGSLASGPCAEMRMLLERTIFQVDVLTLTVRVDPGTAARLCELVEARTYSDELADTIAATALSTRDAWVRTEFERGVGLDQFVDGVRDNMARAREAGILEADAYEMIADSMPHWFSFLRERRIRDGDRIEYRIRGDSLRTLFRAANGEVLLDVVHVGPERRLALLGSYLAPGSEFRERLVRSLFRREENIGDGP